MIKCEVSVCGTINKEAIIRTNKDGKSFMSFAMNIVLPTTSGSKLLDVSVLCDCEKNNDVSKFCVGTRLMHQEHCSSRSVERTYISIFMLRDLSSRMWLLSILSRAVCSSEVNWARLSRRKPIRKGINITPFQEYHRKRCQMALSISGSVSLISVKFLMTLSNQNQRWRLEELWICLSSKTSLPSAPELKASAHMHLLPTHLIKNSYGCIS